MLNYQRRKLLTFVLLLLGATTISFAQPKINSPFSRIGVGDLVNPAFSHARGMGSLSAAYNDPAHINSVNPASYSFLQATAFDVGVNIKRTELSDDQTSQTLWTGNLDYISLGFPTKNPKNRAANPIKSPWHWGMNFSFIPYSNVGYQVDQTKQIGADTVNFIFRGTGGTFKVHWGNAVRYKNLSVGFNFGYLFGKTTTDQLITFQNLESPYFNDFQDEFSIGGVIWNIGTQYRYQFKKMKDGKMATDGRSITFGAYGNSGNGIDFNTSSLYQRVNPSYVNANQRSRDTIVNVQNNIERGRLPGQFGVGAYYAKVDKQGFNKFGVGVDFRTTAWSNYSNPTRPNEKLNNAWRLGIGGNFTPNFGSIKSYWQKINYQAGFFYGKDPRGFENDLTDYGVTLGLRLPVIRRNSIPSYINFGLEIGQLKGQSTINETYGRLTVGFTLNNNDWFLKRKFY